jgi:hypothetical protein
LYLIIVQPLPKITVLYCVCFTMLSSMKPASIDATNTAPPAMDTPVLLAPGASKPIVAEQLIVADQLIAADQLILTPAKGNATAVAMGNPIILATDDAEPPIVHWGFLLSSQIQPRPR